jgi:hypothetical protein
MVKRVVLALAAVAAVGALSLLLYRASRPDDLCDVCLRPMHQETYYRVHHTDGEVTELCCPRCGIRHQFGREDVSHAEVADYRTTELLNAEEAFFVEGSEVHACVHEGTVQKDLSGSQYSLDWDRCLPSLIAFDSRQAAEAFQRTNGGIVRSYDELLAEGF